MFETFEIVKTLAKKQGLSLNQLEDKLGYSRNTLYGLKTSIPKSDRIQEIAEYFNVSTDYLLGRTDNPRIASDGETTEVDLKKMAAESMSYDGHALNEEDIDLIASILETRIKNRQD